MKISNIKHISKYPKKEIRKKSRTNMKWESTVMPYYLSSNFPIRAHYHPYHKMKISNIGKYQNIQNNQKYPKQSKMGIQGDAILSMIQLSQKSPLSYISLNKDIKYWHISK